jgi:hypothetical protein
MKRGASALTCINTSRIKGDGIPNGTYLSPKPSSLRVKRSNLSEQISHLEIAASLTLL